MGLSSIHCCEKVNAGARYRIAALIAILVAYCSAFPAYAKDGDNIAPSAPYTLTPPPNYDLATGRWDKVLNDERRANHWVGSKAVGWYWRSPIIYRQEFQSPTPIKSVELGTFQGSQSEVGIPANAFVYAKSPNGRWVYLGDATEVASSSDGAQTAKLSFPPVNASSVLIVIFRSAPYLILDEVRIVAGSTADPKRTETVVADALDDAVMRRRIYAVQRAGTEPLGGDPASKIAWPIANVGAEAGACRITQIAPLTESAPADIAAAKASSIRSIHAVDGWLEGLVRIENTSTLPLVVKFGDSSVEGVEAPETLVAQYVLGLDYKWRADVLVPTSSFTLPPHSMGLALLKARVIKAGPIHAAIKLSCGNGVQNIRVEGRAVDLSPKDRPFGTTWSYLKGPARNLPRCGAKIDADAWIDTAVVDSAALLPRQAGRTSALLRTYLRTFASSRRLLLFMDVTDPSWVKDEGPQFEEQLKTWWLWVSKAIREEGYSGEVMFYPVDEGRGASIDRLNAAAEILRRIAPSIPVYATIDDINAAYAARIDAPQYLDRILTRHPPRPEGDHAPQIYATESYAKTLGLSSYYRRLSWLAFGEGWEGAGVWSMWDSNGAERPSLGWSDFGGSERDFGLIYADKGGCPLPSRRLMAFQRGLEDFSLLRMCSRLAGDRGFQDLARTTAQSDQWDEIRLKRNATPPEFDAALSHMIDVCTAGANNG
ncbi:MAG: hypothetical protein R3D51_06910 [Hyphomicrobiaceae bacterium]